MSKIRERFHSELSRVSQWCLVCVRTLRELDSGFDVERRIERACLVARREGNLRGLRMAARDLLSVAILSSQEKQVLLDARLRFKLGEGLAEELRRFRREVQVVVARGRIVNAREYSLIEDSIAEMDPGMTRFERDRMQEMLARYARERALDSSAALA